MNTGVVGKHELLGEMIRREPNRLSTRIRRITRDDSAAEDLAQDVLLRAVRNMGAFRGEAGEASMCAWLDRIARNLAYNHVRDRGRQPGQTPLDQGAGSLDPLMSRLPAATADPAEFCVTAETEGRLLGLIQGLPDGIREVFVLRELHGLSTTETAAALGIQDGLVKWRLHRARRLLRTQLQDGQVRQPATRCGSEGAHPSPPRLA